MKSGAIKTGALCLSVWLLVAGCQRNELCYDHIHGKLHVKTDWCNMPDGCSPPAGVRVSFYCKESGKEYTSYRETDGGEVKVPDGNYDMLVYNSDTEMILFRGEDRFETAEAYLDVRSRTVAGSINGIRYPSSSGATLRTRSEPLIGQPDRNFSVYRGQAGIETNANKTNDTIVVALENCVISVRMAIKVKGISNVKACRASLSGIARSFNLSKGVPNDDPGTVIFDLEKNDDAYVQEVYFFGVNKSSASVRSEGNVQNILVVEFLLLDNTVKTCTVDMTGKLDPGTTSPGESPPPIDVGEVDIPDVEVPGGGFDVGVGDWGEQEDIPIQTT